MLKKSLATILLLTVSGLAQAGIISADFTSASDLPGVRSGGPIVYEHIDAVVGSGVELTGEHFKQNPADWMGGEVWMDFDPLTNILTLTAKDSLDFYISDFTMSNIVFSDALQFIAGITLLNNALLQEAITPTFSFTANSLNINYDKGFLNQFNFSAGGSASFLIDIGFTGEASKVSAPASLAVFSLALAVLGFNRRKTVTK